MKPTNPAPIMNTVAPSPLMGRRAVYTAVATDADTDMIGDEDPNDYDDRPEDVPGGPGYAGDDVTKSDDSDSDVPEELMSIERMRVHNVNTACENFLKTGALEGASPKVVEALREITHDAIIDGMRELSRARTAEYKSEEKRKRHAVSQASYRARQRSKKAEVTAVAAATVGASDAQVATVGCEIGRAHV